MIMFPLTLYVKFYVINSIIGSIKTKNMHLFSH